MHIIRHHPIYVLVGSLRNYSWSVFCRLSDNFPLYDETAVSFSIPRRARTTVDRSSDRSMATAAVSEEETINTLIYPSSEEENDSDYEPLEDDSSQDEGDDEIFDETVDRDEIDNVDDVEQPSIIVSVDEKDSNIEDGDFLWVDKNAHEKWIQWLKTSNDAWVNNYGSMIDAESSPFCSKRYLQQSSQSPMRLAVGTTIILSAFAYQLMTIVDFSANT